MERWTRFSFSLYSIGLIAYLILGPIELADKGWPKTAVAVYFLGLVPLIFQVHEKAEALFLRYYFFWTRIAQRITNPSSKWSIVVDYRGEFDPSTLENLKSALLDGKHLRQPARISGSTPLTLNFSINDSMHFFVELHHKQHTGADFDCLAIRLATIEIGSNSAKAKLEKEVIPFLEKIQTLIRPETSSYTLNIDFLGANPFYSRYMQHLRSDAISDFRINLQVDRYTTDSEAERVQINKAGVHIEARSINSLKELAQDFLFQSPNLSKLLPTGNA